MEGQGGEVLGGPTAQEDPLDPTLSSLGDAPSLEEGPSHQGSAPNLVGEALWGPNQEVSGPLDPNLDKGGLVDPSLEVGGL